MREGMKSEEITKLIEEDEDIGGARPRRLEGPSGPGPLVANLAEAGSLAPSRSRSRLYRAIFLEEILALA